VHRIHRDVHRPWTARDKQSIADHGGMLIWDGGDDFWFAGKESP
jgi:hypothetical protein